MTPERWQQIRDLLEKVLEAAPQQRSALLQRACASDDSLRQEVETLLAASDDVRSSFLQSARPRVTLTPRTKLGEYEVKSLLGSGGMGEVYRARDSRLGRDVAIKVLPSALSADPERLRRFEQEARAAAALNHPNILAVFQMGTYEGAPYLVSELLDGETLREQNKRGKLAMRKAIDYGVQIAHGLAAAHEKGIVHRDLKPENLFVTKDGRLKILDFGLAKLTQPQSGAEHSAPTLNERTEAGVVMGTVGYMAPEQVRGQTADHRADVFAFGAILYEMLAGKRAFQKPTSADTMSAILNEDPPGISHVTSNIPPALQRVVHRCLEKSPEQRFQSASDLAFALDALSSTSEPISAPTPVLEEKALKPKKWSWVAVTSLLVALFIGLFFWWRMPPAIPQITSVTQLTNDAANKSSRLVADGSRLFFTERNIFGWQLVQVSETGGETAPLTSTVPHPWLQGMAPDFSGLLVTSSPFIAPLWWLPLPAGAARRLDDLGEIERASFFPDGQHIAYSKGGMIAIADRDGTGAQVLANVSGEIGDLAISSDGQRIRFPVFDLNSESRSLWEVDVRGHNAHQLLRGWSGASQVGGGNWTRDGSYFVFTARVEGRSGLWALPEKTEFLHRQAREPIRLSAGPLSYDIPVPSRDGAKMFAVGSIRRGEMVRFDPATRQFVPFLSGISAIEISFSKDGKWIVYDTYPDHALWRCRADGSDRLQLTYPPFEAFGRISISPNGAQVAFTGLAEGHAKGAYTVSLQGGPLRMVAAAAVDPVWSPDGNALMFSAIKDGGQYYELRRFDVRDGTVLPIPGGEHKYSVGWSAGDKPVADDEHKKAWIFDPQTRKWSELLSEPCTILEFSPDGNYAYCETSDTPYHKIVRVRLSDGHVETMMEIKELRRVVDEEIGTAFAVGLDGSVLLTRDVGTEEVYALTVKWP